MNNSFHMIFRFGLRDLWGIVNWFTWSKSNTSHVGNKFCSNHIFMNDNIGASLTWKYRPSIFSFLAAVELFLSDVTLSALDNPALSVASTSSEPVECPLPFQWPFEWFFGSVFGDRPFVDDVFSDLRNPWNNRALNPILLLFKFDEDVDAAAPNDATLLLDETFFPSTVSSKVESSTLIS